MERVVGKQYYVWDKEKREWFVGTWSEFANTCTLIWEDEVQLPFEPPVEEISLYDIFKGYKWFAMDENGDCYLYRNKPTLSTCTWIGSCQRVAMQPLEDIPWKESLRRIK